jgi:hypothetical protein
MAEKLIDAEQTASRQLAPQIGAVDPARDNVAEDVATERVELEIKWVS